MSGQRLNVGEHGDIHYRVKPSGRVSASVYFRNAQGVRRRLEATGASKAAARRALLASVADALRTGGAGYTRLTTLAQVAADWLRSIEQLAEAGRRSPRTVALYRHVLDRHVIPEIGGLPLSEVTPSRMDRFIQESGGWPAIRWRNCVGRWRRACAATPCGVMRCGSTQSGTSSRWRVQTRGRRGR